MNFKSRLTRLESNLAAKERVKLFLHGLKEGRHVKSSGWVAKSDERQDFQRLWSLVRAVNCQFSWQVLNPLEQRIERIDDRFLSLFLTELYSVQMAELRASIKAVLALEQPATGGHAGHHSESASAGLPRLTLEAIQQELDIRPPSRREPTGTVTQFWQTRKSLRKIILKEWCECWADLSAIEVAIDWIAHALDGEDPLLPPGRATLESSRTNLLSLKEDLQGLHFEVSVDEPSEERVDRVWQLIELASQAPNW